MLHIEIFRNLYRSNKTSMRLPTQKEIADKMKITESYLSACLLGQKDMKSSAFVELIKIMPKEFQGVYFKSFSEKLEINIGTAKKKESDPGSENKDTLIETIENTIENALENCLLNHGSLLLMSQLTQMIEECLKGKTDKEIKAQIKKYTESDAEFSISWETFLLIKEGRKRIYDEYEAATLARIVDPEKKYTIDQWLQAASVSVKQEENGNHLKH